MMRLASYQRCFAWAMHRFSTRYERLMAARKRELLGGLRGTVLEIGPGTGPNLRHYPSGVRWVGVEPNPYMHPYLVREAQRCGVAADVRAGVAERLPLEAESVDAVVATLVLCSVRDPAAVLGEVERVLKPGGCFYFLEHVAASSGSGLRHLQRWCRPWWQCLADGCRPDRETDRELTAYFTHLEIERFRLPLGLVGPHIAGKALKPVSRPPGSGTLRPNGSSRCSSATVQASLDGSEAEPVVGAAWRMIGPSKNEPLSHHLFCRHHQFSCEINGLA